mgnify:CR=1 FL=1
MKYKLTNENSAFDFLEIIKRVRNIDPTLDATHCIHYPFWNKWNDDKDELFDERELYALDALGDISELYNKNELGNEEELNYDCYVDALDKVADIYKDIRCLCIGTLNKQKYLKYYYSSLGKYIELEEWSTEDALLLMLGFTPGCIELDITSDIFSNSSLEKTTHVSEFNLFTSHVGYFLRTHQYELLNKRYGNVKRIPVKDLMDWLVIKEIFTLDYRGGAHKTHNDKKDEWMHVLKDKIVASHKAKHANEFDAKPTWSGSIIEFAYLARLLKEKGLLKSHCNVGLKEIFNADYTGQQLSVDTENLPKSKQDFLNKIVSELTD